MKLPFIDTTRLKTDNTRLETDTAHNHLETDTAHSHLETDTAHTPHHRHFCESRASVSKASQSDTRFRHCDW